MAEAANRTIQRTFEVLDYLDGKNRPVRLKDITTDLGYPASSASGVLKSLVVLGYLNFDRDTMSYTLTPRINTLGTKLNDAVWQDGRIMAALERLGALTGGRVGLGVQSDIYAQYITVLPARRSSAPYPLRPGAIRPLTRCGIGWALLSLRDDDEVERLRRRVNAKEEDPARRISAATLAAQIEEVRRTGYAFSRHNFHTGVGMIAMPLPRPVGGRQYAMGAAGTVEELDASEIAIRAELRAIMHELDEA
ncbi:IclR family transcriptional regulator [Acidisphaera sp. L21]|uniref:IclR family transcriptional regulator n=1 Tax=Acidisphaera sp. L21 TaxID=1641851 RepID=UPI00131CAFF8|nr:helix-turn-helix domain-containing protein [Acidisphaera sp. L21]